MSLTTEMKRSISDLRGAHSEEFFRGSEIAQMIITTRNFVLLSIMSISMTMMILRMMMMMMIMMMMMFIMKIRKNAYVDDDNNDDGINVDDQNDYNVIT